MKDQKTQIKAVYRSSWGSSHKEGSFGEPDASRQTSALKLGFPIRLFSFLALFARFFFFVSDFRAAVFLRSACRV